MALDRSAVRRDLPYLRRRVRPAAEPVAQPTTQPAAAAARGAGDVAASGAGSGGLTLQPGLRGSTSAAAASGSGGSGTGTGTGTGTGLTLHPSSPPAATPRASEAPAGRGASTVPTGTRASTQPPAHPTTRTTTTRAATPRAARPSLPEPFPAPAIDEVRELGSDHPVLRLDARRSAIGSLIVSCAVAIAWESTDRVTGALSLAPAPGGASTAPAGAPAPTPELLGTPVTTPGNRALVGFDAGDAIVALRHLGSLRRALFIGDGRSPLGVQLFGGQTVTVSTDDARAHPGDERMFVLSLLRIGSLIELRAEPVGRGATPDDLYREFGYQMTARFDTRQPRMR